MLSIVGGLWAEEMGRRQIASVLTNRVFFGGFVKACWVAGFGEGLR